jgi:hypothetical protein
VPRGLPWRWLRNETPHRRSAKSLTVICARVRVDPINAHSSGLQSHRGVKDAGKRWREVIYLRGCAILLARAQKSVIVVLGREGEGRKTRLLCTSSPDGTACVVQLMRNTEATHYAITCRCALVGMSIPPRPRRVDSTWASSRPSDLTTMSFAIPHVKNSRGRYSSWLQQSDS